MYLLIFFLYISKAESEYNQIKKLSDNYWNWRLSDMPQFATSVGIHDYDNQLNDMSEEAYQRRLEKSHRFLERANALEPFLKDEKDIEDMNRLKHELQLYIGSWEFKGYFLPINTLEGPHTYVEKLFKRMPRKSEEDYNKIIERMQKIPCQIGQMVELMEQGIINNITYHEVSMKGLNKSLAKFIVDDPRMSPFYKSFFEILPQSFSRITKWKLQRRARNVIKNELVPAFKELHYFVTVDYLPRENISVETMRKGYYQKLISFHTSTNYTAQQIHNIGLKEVEKIGKKMQEVISQMGLQNTSVKEYSNKIKNDPQNYYNSSDDLLNGLRKMTERIYPRLKKVFHNVPKAKLEIVEDRNPHRTFASYSSGTLDGTEPGRFVMSTYYPKSRPKYDLLTLTLHEAIPGHHFQNSYAIESPKYRNFRKAVDHSFYGTIPSRFPFYSYFREGWALYAESLGFDMQLFDDPLERYGHYSAEMFRACRLVVDTGIHALGWTKEKAVEYMFRYTAFPKIKIEVEIDRYTTWPGQALSYKIGQLKISQLREEAENKLGNKFNIKDFNEVVLDSQGPMEIVEREVRKWIQSQQQI